MSIQIQDAPAKRKVVIPASTRNERALRAAIEVHCPEKDEMRMAARVDIALMRDQASVATRDQSHSAGTIYAEVSRIAAQAVYAPLATSQLLRIRSALSLTMEAAKAVQAVTHG